MTILCATDFSKPAAGAMDVAVDMAKKRGEGLLLWHAVQPRLGDPGDPYVEPMRAECATRLETEGERIRALGLTVRTEAVVGWPEHELEMRMPADITLIIAGARGHARGTHWIIGSVVERLARVTTVPLLVVREAAALRSWMSGTRMLNVILATDLTAVSDFALRRAKLLEQFGPCNLELLYVEYPPIEYARLGVSGPVYVHRPHPVVDDVLTRELGRRADTIDLGGEVKTRLARTLGDAGAFIAAEAEEAHADLVVVGSHQRKAVSRLWQGSIAHGVLHSAETNVLLIPFHTADEDIRALEPPPLTTILAATDFSPCGNRAVAWACTMARPGTQVIIMTVVAREADVDARARSLDAMKSAMSLMGGSRVETSVAVGDDVAATISAAAERVAADVVIVGRHGRSRVGGVFLASVAGEVLTRCRRPVLVVPDPAA